MTSTADTDGSTGVPVVRIGIDALADLVVRPARFFAEYRPAFTSESMRAVFLLFGLAKTIDRTETTLMLRDSVGRSVESMPYLSTWPRFWGMLLLQGTVSAAIMWAIGGWWFKVRVRLSGHAAPDATAARRVYGWANVVWALPVLVATILDSFRHADPSSAMRSASPEDWSLLAASFLSFWIAYRGVRSVFPSTRTGPALLWFVLLPGGIQAVVAAAVLATSWLAS